jgi:hypothetical protein
VSAADLPHLRRVLGTIRGDLQRATVTQQRRETIDHMRADQPACSLSLLRPGVGEEHADRGQRTKWDARHEIDDITFDQAHVAKTSGLDRFEHSGNSRSVDIDPHDLFVRAYFGHLDQRFASAETDVEDDVVSGAEDILERQRRAFDRDSPSRHRPFIGGQS